MSLNAAALRLMADKGLSLADVVEIAAAMEVRTDRTAAERKRRQREREADAAQSHRDITRDTPLSLSPNENNSNPHTHTPEEKPCARKGPFVLPGHIPTDEWNGFVEMRRRIRKPMTDHAKHLAVLELDKLARDGWPPGPVLNHSTMNSYQGLFAPKDQGKRNGHPPANDRSGASLLERLRADDVAAGLA